MQNVKIQAYEPSPDLFFFWQKFYIIIRAGQANISPSFYMPPAQNHLIVISKREWGNSNKTLQRKGGERRFSQISDFDFSSVPRKRARFLKHTCEEQDQCGKNACAHISQKFFFDSVFGCSHLCEERTSVFFTYIARECFLWDFFWDFYSFGRFFVKQLWLSLRKQASKSSWPKLFHHWRTNLVVLECNFRNIDWSFVE